MNKGKKDLEKASESLGSLIERAEVGEEVSEEEELCFLTCEK